MLGRPPPQLGKRSAPSCLANRSVWRTTGGRLDRVTNHLLLQSNHWTVPWPSGRDIYLLIPPINLQVDIDLGPDCNATCMAHPDTYLNKLVVGTASGSLQLWNFSTGCLLFTFQIADCAIRCVAGSTALDVVGVGLADGCVLGPTKTRSCLLGSTVDVVNLECRHSAWESSPSPWLAFAGSLTYLPADIVLEGVGWQNNGDDLTFMSS